MASDDPIPSFLSLQPRKRRQARNPQPQLLFDLEPPPPPDESLASFREAGGAASVSPTKPPAPPTPREPILYTVRQLIAELRLHIESAYTGILNVEGEISNCRPAASGHLYFTLKDGDAQLPVVMFRRAAQLLGFKPKDGLAVEVRGRISVYETRGQLQLIAETLRPRGEGALQIAFDRLKRKLAAEGLFDSDRKRPLPPFPQCIGIVTLAQRRGPARHHPRHPPPPRPPQPARLPGHHAGRTMRPYGLRRSTLVQRAPGSGRPHPHRSRRRLARRPRRLQRRNLSPRHRCLAAPYRLRHRPRDRSHHCGLRRRPPRPYALGRRRAHHRRAAPH